MCRGSHFCENRTSPGGGHLLRQKNAKKGYLYVLVRKNLDKARHGLFVAFIAAEKRQKGYLDVLGRKKLDKARHRLFVVFFSAWLGLVKKMGSFF